MITFGRDLTHFNTDCSFCVPQSQLKDSDKKCTWPACTRQSRREWICSAAAAESRLDDDGMITVMSWRHWRWRSHWSHSHAASLGSCTAPLSAFHHIQQRLTQRQISDEFSTVHSFSSTLRYRVDLQFVCWLQTIRMGPKNVSVHRTFEALAHYRHYVIVLYKSTFTYLPT